MNLASSMPVPISHDGSGEEHNGERRSLAKSTANWGASGGGMTPSMITQTVSNNGESIIQRCSSLISFVCASDSPYPTSPHRLITGIGL